MLRETEQTLADLERAGFDVSSLRRQITTVPVLEAQADNIIGKGILRQDAFTRNSQARAQEVEKLQNQIAQLQAAQNAGAGEGSDLYKAALEVIQEQQAAMLQAGFSEEDVAAISKKAFEKPAGDQNPPPPNKSAAQNPPPKEGNAMPDDNKNFVDLNTFQNQMENVVFGNAALSALINSKLIRAQGMGIEVPSDKIKNLNVNLRQAVSQGRDIETFLDEDFGINAKQKEIDEANRKREIDEAYARGKSEGVKESGVPQRKVSRAEGHHPLEGIGRKLIPPPQEDQNQNRELPKNKYGDTEVFRARGSKDERIAAAVAFNDKVLAGENLSGSE